MNPKKVVLILKCGQILLEFNMVLEPEFRQNSESVKFLDIRQL